MAAVRTILEGFSRLLFALCALVIAIMALSVTYEVVSRYLLGRPTIWVTEISSYLLVAVTFLGAAWTLRIDGHIRMDLLRETGGWLGQRVSDLAMFAVAAIVSAALLWSGWHMTLANYNFGWRASSALGTPLWMPQSLIPLGSLALLIQSLIGVWDTLTGARDKRE
ncbi:TRAP transporter small permease subunit [Salinisphaera aquimarina]|uniref:TRAP transporter small permease protein n=1 Tax=Salinisphaera aquimarina TaxID=2094031 RepID=A0ABV7EQL1_9GAMM